MRFEPIDCSNRSTGHRKIKQKAGAKQLKRTFIIGDDARMINNISQLINIRRTSYHSPPTRYIVLNYGEQRIRIATDIRHTSDHLVVFLHGLGCSKESFVDAFKAAELREFSLCAFDFPGHGDSDKLAPEAYSLQTYADMTLAILDIIRPSCISLVGHSMGGAVGLIASRGVRSLSHFVSIEGNLVSKDCGLVSKRIATQSSNEFTNTGYKSLLEELKQSHRVDSQAWARWIEKCDPMAMHNLACSLVEWSASEKLLDLFKSLDKTAYIYGEQSRPSYLLSRLGAISRYSILNTAHFAMVDNPQNLYETLSLILEA